MGGALPVEGWLPRFFRERQSLFTGSGPVNRVQNLKQVQYTVHCTPFTESVTDPDPGYAAGICRGMRLRITS
jgi:hypothetical protein